MGTDVTLKSRAQFHLLEQKKEQWSSIKDQPAARARYLELLGPVWARENCLLGEAEIPTETNTDLNPDRSWQMNNHAAAACRLLSYVDHQTVLSAPDLLELHGLAVGGDPSGGTYRLGPITPVAKGHQPADSDLLHEIVSNALEWFDSGSFYEMHEVERAVLFLVKMVDILPFERANGTTLRLASSFFLLKAGYPPAVIPAARVDDYRLAIENALALLTQPLVDLMADSVLDSLCFCVGGSSDPQTFRVLRR